MLRRPLVLASSFVPFADGALDLAALRAHLDRLRTHGIGVCLPSSGTAEGHTLTEREQADVLAAAVDRRGAAPVWAMGPEPRTTSDGIGFLRLAEAAGVDATVITPLDPGHGYVPTAVEIEAHLVSSINAAERNVVLASHDAVGYAVPLGLLASLANVRPNVVGVLVTHPSNPGIVAALRQRVPSSLDIVVGGPIRLLDDIAAGASGWMSSFDLNVAPELGADLIAAFDAGTWAGISSAHQRLANLFTGLHRLGGVSAMKAALEARGFVAGDPRPPRRPATAEQRIEIEALLRSAGLID